MRLLVPVMLALGICAQPAHAQAAGTLPVNLTVGGMLQQADWIVKSVIAILVLASIATLAIWIRKTMDIVAGRRSIAQALDILRGAQDLRTVAETRDRTVDAMVKAAALELDQRPSGGAASAAGAKERAEAMIQRVKAAQQRRLSRGLSVLGSIGAAAPFIGLFGTVWGIMNAFIGIAQTQTTNLAVVAPGIAEALLATAFGLVAAIPAVLVYNGITRALAGYRLRIDDAAVHVLCLLSRELDADASLKLVKTGTARGV